MKIRSAAAFAAASLLAVAAQAQAEDPMIKLARGSGCMTCHHIEPGAKGPDGLAPIGPAWKDVAAKYAKDKKAADMLADRIIKGGKGNWGEIPMPPNAVTAEEAKKLATWVLTVK